MSGRGKGRHKARSPTRTGAATGSKAAAAPSGSAERYRSVVAALAEGIVFMNADGGLEASNLSAERILGLTAERQGTIFKVYLPRVMEAAAPAAPSPAPPVSVRGSETILVVEDDEMIRKLVQKVLKANGSTVLVAENGSDAERVAAAAHAGRSTC